MELMEQWISELAGVALPVLFAVNVLANAVPMPGWPISVAAGFVLGFARGFALIFVSQMLGSTAGFYLARTVLRKRMKKIVDRHKKLKAVDHAMLDEGWKAVMLFQMMPLVPFGLQTFVLGMSKVKLPAFLIGTALGALPSIVFYVALGSTGRLLAGDDGGPWKWVLLGVGVVAALALSWLVGRAATKRLAPRRHS